MHFGCVFDKGAVSENACGAMPWLAFWASEIMACIYSLWAMCKELYDEITL